MKWFNLTKRKIDCPHNVNKDIRKPPPSVQKNSFRARELTYLKINPFWSWRSWRVWLWINVSTICMLQFGLRPKCACLWECVWVCIYVCVCEFVCPVCVPVCVCEDMPVCLFMGVCVCFWLTADPLATLISNRICRFVWVRINQSKMMCGRSEIYKRKIQ